MTGGAPADPTARAERALLSLLGLAARDGKVSAAVLAGDASPTQARKLVPLLQARGIPFAVCSNQADLGAALGKGPVSAVGIMDSSFARRAMELAAEQPLSQDRGGG